MKNNRILTTCLIGLLALGAQSCLKDYVEYFDTSSAERLTTYLADLDQMLGSEPNGWRMAYFVGNEDGDFGGINVALKFDSEKGEVTAMSEEDETAVYTSHFVLTTDSGPVLSFDTYNPILHKYGTASSEYYEGRGGDYQFFIVGFDKEKKVVNLKGKRNGKFCTLTPISEPLASFNAKMYGISRNFYVSTFDGFIDGQKVTGAIDVNNHQFTAYEMEVYGQDEQGQPKYDVAETKTVPYILTESGLRFYEPIEIFGKTFEDLNFNFDMEKTDTLLVSPANNVSFKGHIPLDWLPYEFYEGSYTLTYNSTSTVGITLVPVGDRKSFRIKGISPQFDLMATYNVGTGRLQLGYQACLKPDSDEVLVENDRYIIVLCPTNDNGNLWFNSELGMQAVLKLSKNMITGEVDLPASLERPAFNWTDLGKVRSFKTTGFILWQYDTDESSDSSYGEEAKHFRFTGGDSRLTDLKSLTKRM